MAECDCSSPGGETGDAELRPLFVSGDVTNMLQNSTTASDTMPGAVIFARKPGTRCHESQPETIAPVANQPSPNTPGDATVIMSGSKTLMMIPPTAEPEIDVVDAESPGQQPKSR